MFMMSLNTTVIAPALSIIATDLHGINSQTWIATSYLVAVNAFQPLAGKFSDIFGRKPVLMFAISFFFIGCLINALSTSINMLIAGRVIQGFGGGGVLSLNYIIVTDIAPIHLRPRFQSMLTIIYGLASVVGPLIGGAFVDKVNWHWDFWLNVIIGGIAFTIILFFLKKPKNVSESTFIEKLKRIDYFGTIFSISLITCILLGLNWGPLYGWKDAHSIGSFVGAGVSLILLIIAEGWIAKEPILPGRVLLNPSVVIVYLDIMCLGFGFIGTLYFGPIYFQSVFGANSTESGVRLIPYMVCLILGSAISSSLIAKYPNVKYYMVIGAASNVLGFGLFYTVNEYSSWGQQACFFMFCGLAFGLTQQNAILIVQSIVDVKDIAIATSSNNFFLLFASSIGIAIYQALYSVFLKAQFTHLTPDVLAQAQQVGALSNYLYIRQLPVEIQAPIIHAYSIALHNIFILPIVISGIGLIFTLFFRNVRYGKPSGVKNIDEEVTLEKNQTTVKI
ncbi:MFS general substrate transporter [Backusella circina FSU 941]|nr:MFS general substrate transporter [Backusella circina FSU 941]